jgi:hypothetical protein
VEESMCQRLDKGIGQAAVHSPSSSSLPLVLLNAPTAKGAGIEGHRSEKGRMASAPDIGAGSCRCSIARP